MMKRGYQLMFVIGLLVVLALAACGGDDEDEGGTREFYDGGISVDLPGGWTAEAGDMSAGDSRIMLYSSKKITEAEDADDLPNNAAFGAILIGRVYDFEIEEGPEAALRSYLELEGGLPEDAEFEDMEVNGNPATRHTGTEEQNGLEAYTYNVGIIYDDAVRVYVLLYGFKGEQSTFDTTFGNIVNSLVVDAEKLTAQFPG
jgi:hypothetical protein